MKLRKTSLVGLLVALLAVSAFATGDNLRPRIVRWTPPATFSSHSPGRIHALSGEIGSGPFPFFPVTPCRQYDSRNSTPLLQATPRSVPLAGAPCGVPTSSLATAVNITVFNITGATGNAVFQVGTTCPPSTAWINYPPTEVQRANAGAVPTDGSGNICVQIQQGAGQVDFVVDVYGYYYNGNSGTAMPTGDIFQIVGNVSGGGAIVGQNASTAGSSWGILGQINSTAPGGFSSGVRGINNGTGGLGIGVYGSQNGSGWGGYFTTPSGIGVNASGGTGVQGTGNTYGVYGTATTNGVYGTASGTTGNGVYGTGTGANGIGVFGNSPTWNGVWAASGTWDAVAAFGGRDGGYFQGARYGAIGNSTPTSGILSGLIGSSASGTNGATGVWGQANGTAGFIFGVKGTTASTFVDGAGVKGVSGWGDPLGDTLDCGPCFTSGVRGVSDTTNNGFGVLGIGRDRGTSGFVLATTGTAVNAYGTLGYFAGGTTYYGVFSSGDFGGTGAKFFVEPHQTDASRVIRYVALEGPEAGTYFRGSAQTRGGEAIIDVPESFRQVTDEEGMTVQVTPVGDLAMVAVISQDLNQIVVHSSKDVKFHYLVQGVRHGYANYDPIVESNTFVPEKATSTMPMFLNDAQKAKLIANGTYNRDGSVNMQTAVRMGWAQKWREEEAAQAARAAAHQPPAPRPEDHN